MNIDCVFETLDCLLSMQTASFSDFSNAKHRLLLQAALRRFVTILSMRLTGVLFATARVIRDVGSPRLRAAGRLNKAAISLTPNAIERIKELMAERPEMTALRVRTYDLNSFD